MSRSPEQLAAELGMEICGADMATGRQLVAEGWLQTSRSYRAVARLPEGKTGLETLKERNPRMYRNIMEQAERQAASTVLRTMTMPDERKELTIGEFAAFRKLGGLVA